MIDYTQSPGIPVGKPKPTKTCLCGKDFIVKPCHLHDQNKKYCSNECRYKHARTTKRATFRVSVCEVCKTEFSRELGKGGNIRNPNKYCSRKCQVEGMKKAINVSCCACEKTFEKKLSKSKTQKHFCSRQCLKKWCKDNPPPPGLIASVDNAGSKNGQYKHGRYAGRDKAGGDSSKKKVRDAVKNNDGNWCLLCGRPGPGLHLHRVIYGSQGGKYEVDNCVLLCAEDHESVHSSKVKWAPILLKHLGDRKNGIEKTIS